MRAPGLSEATLDGEGCDAVIGIELWEGGQLNLSHCIGFITHKISYMFNNHPGSDFLHRQEFSSGYLRLEDGYQYGFVFVREGRGGFLLLVGSGGWRASEYNAKGQVIIFVAGCRIGQQDLFLWMRCTRLLDDVMQEYMSTPGTVCVSLYDVV